MKNLKIRFGLFSLLAILAASVFLTSCEQDEILTGENVTKLEKIALETTAELNTMSEEGIVDRIVFYETADFVPHYYINIGMSPKAYKLDKQNPATAGFVQLIKSAEKSHTAKPLKVTIEEAGIFVNNVVEASEAEEKNWKESSKGKLWDRRDVITDHKDVNLEDIGDMSLKDYSVVFSSYTQIRNAFNTMNYYRCASYGPNLNGCIPFNYKADGCYARAHRMRQLMESNYNRTCYKMFVYADVYNGKELNIPGCSNGWTYHVAPIVKSQASGIWYVIDPSLETGPAGRSTWKSRMGTSNICQTRYRYNTSYSSTWGCSGNTFYSDSNYSKTNSTLAAYERRSGC